MLAGHEAAPRDGSKCRMAIDSNAAKGQQAAVEQHSRRTREPGKVQSAADSAHEFVSLFVTLSFPQDLTELTHTKVASRVCESVFPWHHVIGATDQSTFVDVAGVPSWCMKKRCDMRVKVLKTWSTLSIPQKSATSRSSQRKLERRKAADGKHICALHCAMHPAKLPAMRRGIVNRAWSLGGKFWSPRPVQDMTRCPAWGLNAGCKPGQVHE
jgi:hypothetical protein